VGGPETLHSIELRWLAAPSWPNQDRDGPRGALTPTEIDRDRPYGRLMRQKARRAQSRRAEKQIVRLAAIFVRITYLGLDGLLRGAHDGGASDGSLLDGEHGD